MTNRPVVPWFGRLIQRLRPVQRWERPDLHILGTQLDLLPPIVQESMVARRYLDLLSPLAWERFPDLTRLLREIPDQAFQFLLTSSVALLQTELTTCGERLDGCIAIDTKHIIAWVKENNPKAYISNRTRRNNQPVTPIVCSTASAAGGRRGASTRRATCWTRSSRWSTRSPNCGSSGAIWTS